ncbi:MAG: 4Fe-4S binding protein [Deltaproteobacteria bacterium]|nr:4Fe-4S binding protein [Deltaproteobacteria bacterium]
MLSLRFPRSVVGKPIVCNLVKRFDLTFNILSAIIYPHQEGRLVMELSGNRKEFNQGVRYLKEMGVRVEKVGHEIHRNENICYQCGTCTSVCPTEALWIKRPEMDIIFEPEKCSACELCISVCPPRAMTVKFNSTKLL